MSFRDPWLLALLLLIPLHVYLSLRSRSAPSLAFSGVPFARELKPSLRLRFAEYLFSLRSLGLMLLVFGLARPQKPLQESRGEIYGVDIMLVLDVSTSMLAEDLKPSRVEAAKDVVRDFISKRKDDRVGLVVFAGRPYVQCPLTLDHDVIVELLDDVEAGMIEDGTAVGMALGAAVNRLRESDAKTKLAVLLTDGRNNMGEISPETAAQAAAAVGVKVYTVGAGTRDLAPYPFVDAFGRKRYSYQPAEVDDESLTKIAQITGGRYFRATDLESLQATYEEIDHLEKARLPGTRYGRYRELFPYFVFPAAALVLIEMTLANTWLRRTP